MTFKILKIAGYAFLGYVLYELIMGMARRHVVESVQEKRSEDRAPQLPPTPRRRTGGKQVIVHDVDGSEHQQKVGRGVIS